MKATMGFKNGEIKTGDEWYDDDFAPTTFEIAGVDTGSAKVTPEQALVYAKASYQTQKQLFKDAAGLVLYDHVVRSNGKEMESKFDGTDAVTGEAFKAGTKIIFFAGSRTASKGAVIA